MYFFQQNLSMYLNSGYNIPRQGEKTAKWITPTFAYDSTSYLFCGVSNGAEYLRWGRGNVTFLGRLSNSVHFVPQISGRHFESSSQLPSRFHSPKYSPAYGKQLDIKKKTLHLINNFVSIGKGCKCFTYTDAYSAHGSKKLLIS